MEDLVAEAERLAAGGVVELNLIAQDLTAYGHHLPGRPHLANLLAGLAGVEGIRWIRMLYAYPRAIPERFLELWAAEEKIVPYVDMPLQHISDRMLRRMRRPANGKFIRDQVKSFRARVGAARGGLTFRTTFIVGHPGETEDDFAELMDFVGEMRFERVGVFPYSDEEDTTRRPRTRRSPRPSPSSAGSADGAGAEDQRRAAAGAGRAPLEVLVEGVSEETDLLLQGRHAGQAPEIDGLVFINRGEAAPGESFPWRSPRPATTTWWAGSPATGATGPTSWFASAA